MSLLLERHVVRCPYNRAQQYLAESIAARAASGEKSLLTLTVSGPGLELIKDVVVTFGAGVDPMHFDEPWKIHWEPQYGPYPEFDGELVVRADENYSSSLLELRGTYRPPGGVLGAAFDWALGARIATATARALLKRVGDEMEQRYQQEEQAKRSTTA
jgi:hypothetical protein